MHRKTHSQPRFYTTQLAWCNTKTVLITTTLLVTLLITTNGIASWRTRRALKHASPPPPYMDVTIDTYLARVVDTITTTAAQPQGWRSLQAGFRAAVLDDAKACVADQHDPAWRSILDAAAAEQAQADASAESGVERDAAGAGLWDELRSMLVFESEQVCAARSLSVWTTRSKPQYLLAGNMRDAQEVAPHLIRQLVIAAAVMQHHADVSVSVYESNSQDATGKWLQVLHVFLELLNVPNRIVIGGALKRGVDPTTHELQPRIAFLAQLRNRLLEPLEGTQQEPALPQAAGPPHSALWDPTTNRPLLPQTTPLGTTPATALRPHRIVFFNDAYVCAWHILRLLSHNADMVCGIDFWRSRLRKPRLDTQVPSRVKHPEDQVYDVWVARDVEGSRFRNKPPYLRTGDDYVMQRAAAGDAFPVSCCWNGVVAVDATPFLSGLRFRAANKTECAASECSLLCQDLLLAGHTRIAMDPSVRTAYLLPEAEDLYTPYVGQFGGINGTGIAPPVSPIDWSRVALPPKSWECCPLRPGDDFVDFSKCKRRPLE